MINLIKAFPFDCLLVFMSFAYLSLTFVSGSPGWLTVAISFNLGMTLKSMFIEYAEASIK